MYTFPTSDLDRPLTLLSLLGSFWANTYQGQAPVQSIVNARAILERQSFNDLQELTSSMSYQHVPVLHTREWHNYQLLESQKSTDDMARFDGTYAFDGTRDWGVPVPGQVTSWPAPADLVDVRVIVNRLSAASVVLVRGLDFGIIEKDGTRRIAFRSDPFLNELIGVEDTLIEGAADRVASLWLYRGTFDWHLPFQQYGYVLGLPDQPSSAEGKQLMVATFEALVDGGTALSINKALAAVAGVPLVVSSGEVVQQITNDDRHLWVITDQQAYAHNVLATPTVIVGDVLSAGQTLTDALESFDINRGQLPNLRALAVGRGFLNGDYTADLVFVNEVVPWLVVENVNGYTKASFAIGGAPADITKFWDEVHARGVASGTTLAMLLDQRPLEARTGQPTAAALPATVVPLHFLLQNIFRNNLALARARPAFFGVGALGLQAAVILRKALPAGTALIILVELVGAEGPVGPTAPGSATSPGATEGGAPFRGNVIRESLGLSLLSEGGRPRRLQGDCS